MAHIQLSALAGRLANQSEAVCRRYLSNGKRNGRYWVVGDVQNTPGQSMQVRLYPSNIRPAGKWVDYATGEHGDLLDIIKLSQGLTDIKDVVREAREFLALPYSTEKHAYNTPASRDKSQAIQRLWSMSQLINGTLAARYLQYRGIALSGAIPALRFHPQCLFRSVQNASLRLPAMIAAATDSNGNITGLHRTFLDASGIGKAAIEPQRKAMGKLAGSSIRFGTGGAVQLAGEGIETVLSLRTLMPNLTMHAAGSAFHLPSIPFDRSLQRLYIAHDNDDAGAKATDRLINRAAQSGIEVIVLMPQQNDFNDDLRAFGADHLRNHLRIMLHPADRHYLLKTD